MNDIAMSEKPISSIKGFNPDLTCRGFQFAAGETYSIEGKIKACHLGFHAIEGNPLEVFEYYPPATSIYHEVEQTGALSRHARDSKLASAEITIKAQIHLPALIARAVQFVFDRAKIENTDHATGDYGAASSTGYQGAASSTGYQGAASSTGYQGAASSTGYQGAASSTGARGAASSTGYQGAASSTGYQGAASSTGYQGAASSTGKHSFAVASGFEGKARASDGCGIALVERNDDGMILAVFAGIAGRGGLKADTFYTLRDGNPVEAQS